MKYKMILVLMSFSLHGFCNAESRVSSIKDSLVSFLKAEEHLSSDYRGADLSDALVCEVRLNKRIIEGMTGIFWFTTLSSGSYTHIVVVNKNWYQILNMREPLEKNLSYLCEYLRKNEGLTRDDILKYIEGVIRIFERNNAIKPQVIAIPDW